MFRLSILAEALSELDQKLRLLKVANQKRDSMFDNHRQHTMDSQTKDSEAYIEETTLTRLQQHNGAAPMTAHSPNGASSAAHSIIASVMMAIVWMTMVFH